MWSLQDAKNKFSAVVDAALAGEPQEVTRRGKPAVVVLSASEYARILAEAQSNRGSFAKHLLTQPRGEVEAERAEARPRDVAF
ncbi:type II toxin-antitoxin system Phd/YefM family antitoxin [Paracoccus albus]|uniref:type II toxin-antitoxin system Phd/YefM family antitoxin n=1 Tax=Paracoccus albus TaxID=3017784 RepID=UPI0022F12684|nr:type II toxin-antitoxin system Phd/YefM family antitoxin [Paracoccus albus]WBU62078.1 type II toxin-antitoxin system Phd/YefM family antitoxin [Paracoccus albus]